MYTLTGRDRSTQHHGPFFDDLEIRSMNNELDSKFYSWGRHEDYKVTFKRNSLSDDAPSKNDIDDKIELERESRAWDRLSDEALSGYESSL